MSDFADSLAKHSLWDRAIKVCQQWSLDDRIPAMSLMVGTKNESAGPFCFGRRQLNDAPVADSPDSDETLFLIASITKPILAMGILQLVEQGELLLGTKVSDLIPEFGRAGTYGITIRHLLTHTSGLPDMLPDNRSLRENHAPLSDFVAQTCSVDLEFPTGRDASYSSMGFTLLGEVIQRVTGQTTASYLQQNLFEPLGMHDSVLGAPAEWYQGDCPKIERVAESRIPADWDLGADWNWNSRYWRTLGAPWGGVISSASDLSRFARMMLCEGELDGRRVLSRQSIRAAISNQLDVLKDIPEQTRRCRSWGLGWRRHWPAHSANFGDLLSTSSFGHWGATGTVLWVDPKTEIWAVILTTEPQEPRGTLLARLSNLVAAAVGDIS
ncbi:MAG: serine hydrolase [Planctomycetaceae bacterium]|jgi:CubicO group peptidase (beta-lactamase class C family)|nr:beta-lactamase family protein [Planctomycetaceae bacterium]MDG2390323.1 serine hydrolase [Planctomycetaceae bacterium]